MDKLVFAVEPFAKVFDEALPLIELHFQEIESHKNALKLSINREFYELVASRQHMLVITARHEAKLVGYCVWFITRHPHARQTIMADLDVYYLLPGFRQGLNGYLLLREAVTRVKALGVRFLKISEKMGHERPQLMRRLGFRPTNITYTLAVGD